MSLVFSKYTLQVLNENPEQLKKLKFKLTHKSNGREVENTYEQYLHKKIADLRHEFGHIMNEDSLNQKELCL